MQIFKCYCVANAVLNADQSAQLQPIDICCLHRHKEHFGSLQSRLYFNSNFQGKSYYKTCLYWYINIQILTCLMQIIMQIHFAFAVDYGYKN